ncbi:MAG: SH3 domain-containing protein [Rhodospirillaceae bacterium]|jgi:uncharacterized protein YgiM (DUF1202 family)|nr:SH3 domain-containing protein [Rhodospirillaceae bacterium]MBT5456001.1 SH3 domain-containing protein [Rhodospirillaceae bacterium]
MILYRSGKKRFRLMALVGLVCALLLSSGEAARACGTLQGLSDRYWDVQTSNETRRRVIKALAGVCGDYVAYESDAILLAIFRDALARNIERAIIRKSFEAYWCLMGSRDQQGYAGLTAALGRSNCPSDTAVKAWYVVTVSGANIRAGADMGSRKTGYALRGTLVERLATQGDWFRIRRMSNETGFIHASLLTPFRKPTR